MYALQFLTIVISTLIAYALGWALTEKTYLPNVSSLFDFKAFYCRKCLSFHFCWVINTFISLLWHNYILLVFGIICAIFLYIGLYLDEKSRFIE